MCFSFTQNNPKQLQGNSAQCTDKEPWVVSSGRTRSNPFQPWSIHYGITMITFWAPRSRHAWIHPLLHSTTPSCNAVFIHLATSNFQLDTRWHFNNQIFSYYLMVIPLWLHVVQPWTLGLVQDGIWDIAQHLMLGCYQEKWQHRMKVCLFHTHIPLKILILPLWGFSTLFLWRYVTEDALVSFPCSCMMASRCLYHTVHSSNELVSLLYANAGWVLPVNEEERRRIWSASCEQEVLTEVRAGLCLTHLTVAFCFFTGMRATSHC